jgi:hypothetical protein
VVFLGIDVRTGSVLSRTSWRVCKWSTRPTSSWMIQRKHATAVVGLHRSTKPASEQIFRIWQLELRNATHLDIYLLALGRKGDGNVRHAPHTTYGSTQDSSRLLHCAIQHIKAMCHATPAHHTTVVHTSFWKPGQQPSSLVASAQLGAPIISVYHPEPGHGGSRNGMHGCTLTESRRYCRAEARDGRMSG